MTNFKYKVAYALLNVEQGRFLAHDGNLVREPYIAEDGKTLTFTEQRICFKSEEDAVKFVEMLDEDDWYKYFYSLIIVRVLTV